MHNQHVYRVIGMIIAFQLLHVMRPVVAWVKSRPPSPPLFLSLFVVTLSFAFAADHAKYHDQKQDDEEGRAAKRDKQDCSAGKS
jgi:hypothetical protein